MHAAIKLELNFPSSSLVPTYCFQKDRIYNNHTHTANMPQFESKSVCVKYFGGFILNRVYRLLGWLVVTGFFKIQTLTTRGVSSKFSSDALEKLFCEIEPCIFDFNGLDAMNEEEALHGDCQPPPCAPEHEGTGRTTKSSNLLRHTI